VLSADLTMKCMNCGHDLSGIEGSSVLKPPVCPECGATGWREPRLVRVLLAIGTAVVVLLLLAPILLVLLYVARELLRGR
jgi:DNA-directed RNA polymerase subunit RPC12/RpoP